MSLRQQARILGIAPSYLSMMVNGKRPWKPAIKQRYDQLVNTFVNSTNRAGEKIVVPRKGLEPPLPLGKRILSSLRWVLKGSSQFLDVQEVSH